MSKNWSGQAIKMASRLSGHFSHLDWFSLWSSLFWELRGNGNILLWGFVNGETRNVFSVIQ